MGDCIFNLISYAGLMSILLGETPNFMPTLARNIPCHSVVIIPSESETFGNRG